MSSIFFTVNTDNPDHEPVIVTTIYSTGGRKLAEHPMTIEGAVVRMYDFEAAIVEARLLRTPPCPYGVEDAEECGTIRERSVAGRSNTIPDCPVHGQHPDEVLVYAVKVNGEDYMFVAHDEDELKLLNGTQTSYGQCQNCGGFGTLYSTSEEPKAFTIAPATPDAKYFHVVCDGCGIRYSIARRPSKEVCF